jgi:predicted HNH restriction endonuclease
MPISTKDFELPVLRALAELGGSASVKDVYLAVERIMKLSPENTPHEYGSHKSTPEPIWHNKTRWARQFLKDKGELDGSQHNIWTITSLGRERLELLNETSVDPDSQDNDDVGGQVTFETDFEDVPNTVKVPEGKRRLRYHYARERNPRIIRLAKSLALEKYGELRCEACSFSFKEVYGDRAANFIEGHHRLAVSEMPEGYETSVQDIALVCANCHRAIHAKWPYISIEELKELLQSQ